MATVARDQARDRDVLAALTLADLQERRGLTVSGLLKWALEPLSYMAVYVAVFQLALGRDRFAYPLFLMCALVPWRYFTGVTTSATQIVRSHTAPLLNIGIRGNTLPLVVMATEGASFLIALALFPPMMAYYGVGFSPALLWLPVIIAILVVLMTGPAYVLAVFGLYFPDYRGVVQNLVRIGFFASTGLFTVDEVANGGVETVIRANPFSGVFESFRAVILEGQAPAAKDLLYPLAVGVLLLPAGLGLYRWRRARFAKEL